MQKGRLYLSARPAWILLRQPASRGQFVLQAKLLELTTACSRDEQLENHKYFAKLCDVLRNCFLMVLARHLTRSQHELVLATIERR